MMSIDQRFRAELYYRGALHADGLRTMGWIYIGAGVISIIVSVIMQPWALLLSAWLLGCGIVLLKTLKKERAQLAHLKESLENEGITLI